jgi:Domain of unknown function (DUF4405)
LEVQVLKKYVSVTLLISLIAVGSSGLLMIFSHDFGFRLRMHPVHEVFGILMCITGCFHVYFNFRPILNYFGKRPVRIAGIWLTVLLLILYAVGLGRHFDPKTVERIEGAMSHSSSRHR